MQKAFLCLLQRRETVDLHPKNIHWLPLSLSLSGKHIHWHSHEKARILAYWLSKKEEEEAQLTAATRQLLTHHSLSRIAPRYSRRFTKWLSDTIYRTCHSLFWPLVRCVKYQLQLEGRVGGGLPRMISMSLSRHYFFNVLACKKALWLAHRERTKRTLLKTCNLSFGSRSTRMQVFDPRMEAWRVSEG